MRVIQGHLIRIIGRLTSHQFSKAISGIVGSFYMGRRYWIDCGLLHKVFPQEIIEHLIKYSIPYHHIGNKHVRRLGYYEKIWTQMLLLTLEEASQLVRIPVDSLKKAIILGELHGINLGGKQFIARSELERILNTTLDSEKIMRICETSALIQSERSAKKGKKWKSV